MKTGDAAKRLKNVTSQTIRDWIERYGKFFSEDAQGINRKYAEINSDDFIVLATIYELSRGDDKLSHEEIKQKLADGFRVDEQEAYTLEPDMIPSPIVESIIDAAEIRVELEKTKSELERALTILENERQQHGEQVARLEAKIDDLQQQIGELRERAASAETEAKMLREQQEKRRGLFGR